MLINVAQKYHNAQLKINDLDENIFYFWNMVFGTDKEKYDVLLEKVRTIPTIELFLKLRNEKPKTEIEKAYYALFFNKTTFSGIYNAGPIGGYDQSGKWKINCYYKPDKLIKRINNIRCLIKDRCEVTNLSFQQFLKNVDKNKKYLIYLDPPYFLNGKNLYPVFMKKEEHIELKNILSNIDNWVLSYDNHEFIRTLYSEHKIEEISMTKHINIGKNKNCNFTKELVIYKR